MLYESFLLSLLPLLSHLYFLCIFFNPFAFFPLSHIFYHPSLLRITFIPLIAPFPFSYPPPLHIPVPPLLLNSIPFFSPLSLKSLLPSYLHSPPLTSNSLPIHSVKSISFIYNIQFLPLNFPSHPYPSPFRHLHFLHSLNSRLYKSLFPN